MDRLTSMAVFVKVVETGSFTAAAQAFGLSAAMVGKHVRALEERLQIPLLNRTTRRQSLTDVGAQFLEHCRIVLAEVAAAESLAAESQSRPRGLLRVNAPISFGSSSLAEALPDYLRRCPEVRVELSITDRMVDLVDEGFDVVIRIGPLADTSLRARALAPYRLVACAAPAYLAERGTPRHPRDLAGHACLGLAHWVPRDLWSFDGPEGRVAVEVSGPFVANMGPALRVAALQGLGIILQPEVLLATDLAAGRLVALLPDYRPPARPMHLLTPPGRRRTQKLDSFVAFIAERFGPDRA
ncbi:LysR family transcriptional regulator [Pseudogemmobacter sonorensis]|uniref:LysR family transcriptional regulator n=1 Tax=Pseudogemmobacter sonorensis TaxID=2989681 RepID=UPI0036A00226